MWIGTKLAKHMRDIILHDVLSSRLLAIHESWFDQSSIPQVRYQTLIYGIPAIIEVGAWKAGYCEIRWVLWPKSDNVILTGCHHDEWPGEVWGVAHLEGRLFPRTNDFCWIKRRLHRVERVRAVPNLHDQLQKYLLEARSDQQKRWSGNMPSDYRRTCK